MERYIVTDGRGHALTRRTIDSSYELDSPAFACCFASFDHADAALRVFQEDVDTGDLYIAQVDPTKGDPTGTEAPFYYAEDLENLGLAGYDAADPIHRADRAEQGSARVPYLWRVAVGTAALVAVVSMAARTHEGRQAQVNRQVTSTRVHAERYCAEAGTSAVVLVSSTSDGEVTIHWHCK